ncbi:MAG: phytoene desaturase [Bacteroidota bacterium]|jgi:phytoene desaturase
MKKVAIIGSGIAGLASAVRLAVKGYAVEVFEANSYTGGKLTEIILENKYRFDTGPSLFTMPHFVDELFTLAGENPKDYFNYQKLDVFTHYFYEDGTRLKAFADKNLFANEVEEKLNEPKENILKFIQYSERIYKITNRVFMHNSLHKLKTYLHFDTLKSIAQLHKIDSFRTMHNANKSFFKNPKTVQLFDRYATYNGSNPYLTPATLNIIPHLEYGIGAFYPKGGMHEISQQITALAKRLGVTFHLNSKVEEIVIDENTVKGIKVNKTFLPFDKVVSNMDLVHTYRKLLPHVAHPEKLLSQPKSTSALIFYWGISKSFSELGLHNILFSDDYEKEFNALKNGVSIDNDPTIYINITSKFTPSDAPDGHENWFVMINVPANKGQDWDKLITEARENVINKISRILNIDLKSFIVCEDILDPRKIESRTSSYQGALYGNSSNNKFAAFLRHPNFSKKLKNLYFCGGSVHPGGGIPLCLLSAKITSDLISD